MRIGETARNPRELLPLTPALLHVLLALADEERHGYGIMKEVEERTGGEVRLGPGTLYGANKRMLADGLIEESDDRPDPELEDGRRRYYRISRTSVAGWPVWRPSVFRAWSTRRAPGSCCRPASPV